jgi:endonuclease I
LKNFLLFLITICSTIFSQTIFPGQTGQQLLNSLVAQYKPSSVLGYNDARDKMYAIIYNVNDTLECVYTGYKIYVPYNSPDPRTYTNAAIPIMNCEHTWPQSKGAVGNAKSDMHHLYATNGDANAARGSFPFNDINDQSTNNWWKGISYTTTIPLVNINSYSEELTGVEWEPKEAHKGNVARAMFYFYTMYKAEADVADPNYFDLQRNILWQWHQSDPADALEISRTNQIATYQDNKPNPYVLDATLVQRAYFPTSSIESGEIANPDEFKLFQNYPNPFNPSTTISYYIPSASKAVLEIFNVLGQRIYSDEKTHNQSGEYSFVWDGFDDLGNEVGSGMYYYRINVFSDRNSISSGIYKMIFLQ